MCARVCAHVLRLHTHTLACYTHACILLLPYMQATHRCLDGGRLETNKCSLSPFSLSYLAAYTYIHTYTAAHVLRLGRQRHDARNSPEQVSNSYYLSFYERYFSFGIVECLGICAVQRCHGCQMPLFTRFDIWMDVYMCARVCIMYVCVCVCKADLTFDVCMYSRSGMQHSGHMHGSTTSALLDVMLDTHEEYNAPNLGVGPLHARYEHN